MILLIQMIFIFCLPAVVFHSINCCVTHFGVLFNSVLKAQECDATNDAIKYFSGPIKKNPALCRAYLLQPD